MKTVSVVYSPNRFGNQAQKFQLLPGQAFDLTLGHDLLKLQVQDEVCRYLEQVGL